MIEERIQMLILKRDLKQKELDNLKSQRTNRNPYTDKNDAHDNGDAVVNKEIKLLEKSIRAYDEAIETSTKLLRFCDEGKIGYGVTFRFSLENGFSKTVTLVDKLVSADGSNYITDKSPLGAAVMGKKEGDTFSYLTPVGLELNGIINEVYKKQSKQK